MPASVSVLYAKRSNHFSVDNHATGKETTMAIAASFIKSFDKIVIILPTEAPSTFRTPISKLYEIPALLVPNFFINTKANYCHRCPDLLTYFELVLFSYLYCNNDMHLKDLSFMH